MLKRFLNPKPKKCQDDKHDFVYAGLGELSLCLRCHYSMELGVVSDTKFTELWNTYGWYRWGGDYANPKEAAAISRRFDLDRLSAFSYMVDSLTDSGQWGSSRLRYLNHNGKEIDFPPTLY